MLTGVARFSATSVAASCWHLRYYHPFMVPGLFNTGEFDFEMHRGRVTVNREISHDMQQTHMEFQEVLQSFIEWVYRV